MLLEPRTKGAFLTQIATLKPERRRVVILAGRHLNEGTRNIAMRHHKEWEAHGAVTVLVPSHWTPHGFWHKLEKQANEKKAGRSVNVNLTRAINTTSAEVPEDTALIRLLFRKGIRVPVVNLHGQNESAHGLTVILHPVATGWVKNAVVQALRGAQRRVKVVMGKDEYENYSEHPFEVLIEHRFRGVKPSRPLGVSNFARNTAGVPNAQLSEKYLRSARPTRKELERFHRTYGHRLTLIVRKLAGAQSAKHRG